MSSYEEYGLELDERGELVVDRETYRINNPPIFWEVYSETLKENDNIKAYEKVKGDPKLIVSFESTNNVNIINLISKYQTDIVKRFSSEKLYAYCVVLRKDSDNYRIYFPFLKCYSDIVSEMKERIRRKVGESFKIKDDRPYLPVYGSDGYSYCGCYDNTGTKIKDSKLVRMFSVQNHISFYRNPDSINIGDTLNDVLPLLLSVGYEREGVKEKKKNQEEEKKIAFGSEDYLLACIEMIPRQKKNFYHIWHDIGKVFHNFYNGSELGLARWLEMTKSLFSRPVQGKKSRHLLYIDDVFDSENLDDALEDLYNNMDTYHTIRTTEWYAKIYNPKEYNRFSERQVTQALNDCVGLIPRDIARLFFVKYRFDFACTSSAKERWWRYDTRTHRWRKTDNACEIKRYMNEEFLFFLKERKEKYENFSKHSSDPKEKIKNADRVSNLDAIMDYLGGKGKRSVIDELEISYKNEDFFVILNASREYFLLNNGIVETINYHVMENGEKVRKGKAIYRPGKPEDYKSQGSKLNWRDDFSYKHRNVVKAMIWLEQLFPDYETRVYVIDFFSSLLMGGNPDKIVASFLGKGNNGKSGLINVLSYLLGDDFCTLPYSAISRNGKSNSGDVTHVLNLLWSCRLGAVSELGSNDFPDSGQLKSLSGNDEAYLRGMYKDGGRRKILAKVVIAANFLPPLAGADAAMVDRKVIFPFVTIFTNRAPSDPAIQKLKNMYPPNKDFEKEIPSLASGLLFLMINNYSKYIETDMKNRPEMVKQVTNNYWYNTDVYMQFVEDCLEKAYVKDGDVDTEERDMEVSVSVQKVYDMYKIYLERVKPSAKLPNIFTVRKEISNRIGQTYEDKWWAVSINKKGLKDASRKNDGTEKLPAQIEDFGIYQKDILGKTRLMYEAD